MDKLKFEYIKFTKWVGTLCIIFATLLIINAIIWEFTGVAIGGILQLAFQYILYGIIILGIGKLVDLFEQHYLEMKFFRKHYIDKDDEITRVLKNNKDN